MSNRRRQEHDPLARPAETDSIPMDAQVYGAIESADRGMQTAFPISIMDIVPDARQPRRQIPSIVRQGWDGDATSTPELFGRWVEMFAEEVMAEVNVVDELIDLALEGEEISPAEVYQGGQVDPKRNWGVIGGSLMAVVTLAAEIRRDGLTNPITVARVGNNFLIETGERRWLAFHLLHIFFPDSSAWERIPAREVARASVWRQASENTQRAQLNAISMARQLAILLMDLHGDEDFMTFDEIVLTGGCDRVYYAQVADGQQWRVPRGKGEQLVNAMGIKNPVQLRQYRDLLRLPDEAWMLADDLNWEEGFIRTRILEFSEEAVLRVAKARQLADDVGYRVTDNGHTVTPVTVSDEEDEPAREEWPQDDADEDPESQPEDDRPVPDLPYWITQVLEFAYERAASGRPFFAAKDSPSNPDRMNQLIADGLLRGRSPYTTSDWSVANYAISDAGCSAIGRPVPAYPHAGTSPMPSTAHQPVTPPVSAGQALGGTSSPTPSTPPVQVDPQVKQARLERKIQAELAVLPRLIASTAERIAVENMLTEEGQEVIKQTLLHCFNELHAIRDRLPAIVKE